MEVNCLDIQELKLEGRVSGKSNSQSRNQIRFKSGQKTVIINGTDDTGITKLYYELKRCDQEVQIDYSKYYFSFPFSKVYIL